MSKKKLARAIGVCTIAIMIIIAITILPSCESSPTVPTLVTHDCTDQATTSLKAQGEVTDDGGTTITRRGFVFQEGTEGDPGLNLTSIPLVNPSFEEGDPPTGWTNTFYVTTNQSTEQVKIGSYSLKCSLPLDHLGYAYQDIPNHTQYADEVVTLGAWVWADTASRIRLCLNDGIGDTLSAYHPGDSTWHWLSVSRTIDSSPTRLQIDVGYTMAGTAISSYVDGVVLIEGNAVFEDGEFGTGTYSLTITGLKPDTSYRVRAFVENEAGISYGNTVTCKTAAD